MSASAWVSVIACVFGVCASSAFSQVELRGQRIPIEAMVESADISGLIIKPAGSVDDSAGQVTERIVSWDQVRAAGGDAAPFEQIADDVWRARARLERGDWKAAEPLFESLLQLFEGASGPTASVVAEGTLRTRLLAGRNGLALRAWLQWVGVNDAAMSIEGVETRRTDGREWIGGRIEMDGTLDGRTRLIEALPPVYLAGLNAEPEVRAGHFDAFLDGEDAASMFAQLYKRAAEFEVSEQDDGTATDALVDLLDASDSGVRLIAEMVVARTGISSARSSARALLQARIANPEHLPPRWMQAWCHLGIGRSLLIEESVSSKRQGIVSLLSVPSGFASDQPELSALALAEAAVALDGIGNRQGAARVRFELNDRFGDQPASSWSRLARIQPP